jgi:PAS domain S-box-containing protein
MPARPRLRISALSQNGRQPPPRDVLDAGTLPWTDLLDMVPAPIWVIGPQADLWFGNSAWHALTSAAAPLTRSGTEWLLAVHEDDRRHAVTAFRSATAGRRLVSIDVRLRSDEGYSQWSLVGSPYCTPSGDVEMFVGAAYDITEVQETQQRLRDLGTRLVAAQESERARIARELHDDVAQRVALLTAKLCSAERTRPFSTGLARRALTDAREMLHEISNGIHLLSSELHPPKLTLLGLGAALKGLCDEVADGSGIPVQFLEDGGPISVTADTALCFFRVTQEALQNAVKHSGGRRIAVRLRFAAAQLTLWVADDGVGFEQGSTREAGLGLTTMRERVELINGRFRIISEPGCGTMVEAMAPLPALPDSVLPEQRDTVIESPVPVRARHRSACKQRV